MQQVALLQAAVALSASLGRVMSSTKGQLRHKLWDDWGTNRTITVWQTIALVTTKTNLCNLQQVALLQAAVALSASLGRVMSSTKGQLRHKLWDDWGTNRTVTVWQTVQVLSDKLTRRCVTSYLSAMVTSKTNSYATSRSITSCSCVVSKSWTRYVINQRATASQAMGCLRHKQNSHCVTNYGGTIRQTN